MKKIIAILTVFFISLSLCAQKGSEYRYFGVKPFLSSNFSLPAPTNNQVLIKSPYGDLPKENNEIFSYTPGGGFALVYNYDFKSERYGVVFGLEVQNFGFKNHYRSIDQQFNVVDQYRAIQIGIPIYLKFGAQNIYRNQSYFVAGIQLNQFLKAHNIQKSSWTSDYFGFLPKEERKTSSVALILGYNINIYFVTVQLNSSSFVNSNYMTNSDEGVIAPYEHINIINNLYIVTGINVPLTRWLTARNWTAEKIRRTFKRN